MDNDEFLSPREGAVRSEGLCIKAVGRSCVGEEQSCPSSQENQVTPGQLTLEETLFSWFLRRRVQCWWARYKEGCYKKEWLVLPTLVRGFQNSLGSSPGTISCAEPVPASLPFHPPL